MLSCPESRGWQWKHLNGHVYMAMIEPKPEEVPGREKMFRERMMPFVDDLAGGWARDSAEDAQAYSDQAEDAFWRIAFPVFKRP
jgi:hypothetical protein